MEEKEKPKSVEESVEGALLDAELFVKYRSAERAIQRLQEAVAHHPRSIILREKLREVAVTHRREDEAARQCLVLVNLYISRENFEAAHERLLEAIRRARRPELHHAPPPPAPRPGPAPRRVTFAGDLATVSVFDAVQVIENSRLTGVLKLESADRKARVLFNEGRIVGAEAADLKGTDAFRVAVEMAAGEFDFEKSDKEFPVTIESPSNTNLILDTLRQLDEENNEGRDDW